MDILETSREDEMLLKGAVRISGKCDSAAAWQLRLTEVPQPRDWLMLWRFLKTPASFKAASLYQSTSEYLRRTNSRTRDPSASALSCMVDVMAEVERKKTRKLLDTAESISIGVDDRKHYRLFRARLAFAED